MKLKLISDCHTQVHIYYLHNDGHYSHCDSVESLLPKGNYRCSISQGKIG